jgi:hypothetical protein
MKWALKILILSLSISLFSSCATINVTPNMSEYESGYHSDKEFIKYIERFKKIGGSAAQQVRVNMTFGTLGYSDPENDSNTVGLCYRLSRLVLIDKKWWKDNDSDLKREELIFHELGHCALGRGHTGFKPSEGVIRYYLDLTAEFLGIIERKGYLQDGCPYSYMYPYVLSENCIEKHREHYYKELFSEKNNIINEEFNKIAAGLMSNQCQETKIVNSSKNEWNQVDIENLIFAKSRCAPLSAQPCLVNFIKLKNNEYKAYCGS